MITRRSINGKREYSTERRRAQARAVAATRGASSSGDALRTAWWGRLEPLCTRSCLRAFLTYPLMTWGVIARIHIQALRLFAKRVPFFRKPPTPLNEVTE